MIKFNINLNVYKFKYVYSFYDISRMLSSSYRYLTCLLRTLHLFPSIFISQSYYLKFKDRNENAYHPPILQLRKLRLSKVRWPF